MLASQISPACPPVKAYNAELSQAQSQAALTADKNARMTLNGSYTDGGEWYTDVKDDPKQKASCLDGSGWTRVVATSRQEYAPQANGAVYNLYAGDSLYTTRKQYRTVSVTLVCSTNSYQMCFTAQEYAKTDYSKIKSCN